ncbi:pyridoxal phosphate-dependent transferase [Diplogelasinospora grovesii]|uniref:Pyridoxal phosphate-dependent transferase n=1 Tax=Diplogelasinospora grovesii TaxID=303347 RepID=A0AAN6MYR2_9PEZI|nr:pyridoxal phosphate-dependent transferase [Diplogelasinospora grovesii]
MGDSEQGVMSPVSIFGGDFRQKHFSFDSSYRPLNHGSFGTSPNQVLDYQQQLLRQSEARPDTFILAPLLGAHTDEVVFVPNATTGVNTILRNLDFRQGDVVLHFNTIYGACLKTIQSLGETTPVVPHCIEIKYPIEDDEILRKFEQAVEILRKHSKTVRLAMFDTVLTFPGVRFPWESLVRLCKRLSIQTLIDGAHGVGHIDLRHLGDVGPDFVISNCYTWLMVPRGCALLYVPFRNQHWIHTTFPTSWGYETPATRDNMKTSGYFTRLFVKVSTTDTTPYVCVPAALKFRQEVCGGEENIRQYCEKLAREGGQRMANAFGTEVLENTSKTLQSCCFTNVRLPLDFDRLDVPEAAGTIIAKWIQEKTPHEYETYIPTKFYAGAFWSRISGQIYLTIEDFEWAAGVLLELCKRVEAGEWRHHGEAC